MSKVIGSESITKAEYDTLKKSYKRAVEQNLTEFEWCNETVLTSYTKYLIEYLDSKFKNMK